MSVKHYITTGASGVFLLLSPLFVHANAATDAINSGLSDAGKAAGFSGGVTFPILVGQLIQGLLSMVGIVFLILLIYAGILYIGSMGDEGKVKKAKSIITSTILGIIIIIGAYAFTAFLTDALNQATQEVPSTAVTPTE